MIFIKIKSRVLQIRDTYELFMLNFVYKHQIDSFPDTFNNYYMLESETHTRTRKIAEMVENPACKQMKLPFIASSTTG